MKEFIIIFIILIIIVGGALYVDKYLKNSSEELVEMLKHLKENVNMISNDNTEPVKKEAEKTYNRWEEIEEKWAFIVLHSELDLIETSFVRMKAQIEESEFARSIEEIDATIFLVHHISEKEKFCLKNIF